MVGHILSLRVNLLLLLPEGLLQTIIIRVDSVLFEVDVKTKTAIKEWEESKSDEKKRIMESAISEGIRERRRQTKETINCMMETMQYTDSKTFHHLLNRVRKVTTPMRIMEGGKEITSAEDIGDGLLKAWDGKMDIAKKITNARRVGKRKNSKWVKEARGDKREGTTRAARWEAKAALQSLAGGKASSHDGIPPEVLKGGGNRLIEATRRLMTKMLKVGKYPSGGKISKLGPVPKCQMQALSCVIDRSKYCPHWGKC